MSTPSPKTTDLIGDVQSTLATLSKQALENEEHRKQLLAVLREQVGTLESPLEVIWRMMMEPHQSAALRAAMAMGLIAPITSSASPISATELSSITKCDKQLIVRILRPLSCLNIVSEVGYETYVSTPITKILTVPSVGGGFKFMFDAAATSVVHMPQYLSKNNFKNPEGPMGVFQSAFQTDLQMFPWLMAHPEHMSDFNDLMTGQRMNRVEWFDFADVESILFAGYEAGSEETLMIDIGGGRGHDLEAFRNKFPAVKGKLVLQDLPPVIDDIKELHDDIVQMKYDFITPQPIQGAKVYYLRSILHDYSDTVCRKILKTIVAAMKPGHSKLLLFEWILPNVGTPLYPALLDINMVALLSGMERTETQWRELLESVGLEVVKFWTINKETEGLIEAVVKV